MGLSSEFISELLAGVDFHIPGTCPLFWGFKPPKEGRFQSKQGSFEFGFQVSTEFCSKKLASAVPIAPAEFRDAF